MTGPLAEEGLRRFRASKAFISATGVTAGGVFNASVARASADAVMAQQSSEVYVLADHSKIGRVSLVAVVGLDQVSFLVTDRTVEETDGEWLSKAKVQIVNPPPAEEDVAPLTPRPKGR